MISQNQFVIVRMSCGIASFSCICHILSVVYIYVCALLSESSTYSLECYCVRWLWSPRPFSSLCITPQLFIACQRRVKNFCTRVCR